MIKNGAVLKTSGHIEVSCESCGSIGHSPRTKVIQRITPEIKREIEDHERKVQDAYQAAATRFKNLMDQAKTGRVSKEQFETARKEFADTVAALAADPVAQIPRIVENCPWCDAPLNVELGKEDAGAPEAQKETAK